MRPAALMSAGLESRVRLQVGDMTDFHRRTAARGDVISGVYALHHLPDFARLEACLAEIADLVRAFRFPCLWNASPAV